MRAGQKEWAILTDSPLQKTSEQQNNEFLNSTNEEQKEDTTTTETDTKEEPKKNEKKWTKISKPKLVDNCIKVIATKKYDTKTLIRNVREANLNSYISFSSPNLNYVLGGKFCRGRIMQLFGPESSGKSTISTFIAAEIQKILVEEQPIVLYVD